MRIMVHRDKFSSPEWGSAPSATDAFDDGAGPRGIFDPEETPDEDLWFLPDTDPEEADDLRSGLELKSEYRQDTAAVLPGPKANHTPLINVTDWQVAQAGLATPLANLALLQGRLIERLAPVSLPTTVDQTAPNGSSKRQRSQIGKAGSARGSQPMCRSGVHRHSGRYRPSGWWQRLALQEVADLSWLARDRVPMERLSLWMALRGIAKLLVLFDCRRSQL